jgi:hypothetical protein
MHTIVHYCCCIPAFRTPWVCIYVKLGVGLVQVPHGPQDTHTGIYVDCRRPLMLYVVCMSRWLTGVRNALEIMDVKAASSTHVS